MKEKKTRTVVITGSARGFGLCQAKKFKEEGFNVVISDINETNLAKELSELTAIHPEETRAVSEVCDVTRLSDLENLWVRAWSARSSWRHWSRSPPRCKSDRIPAPSFRQMPPWSRTPFP